MLRFPWQPREPAAPAPLTATPALRVHERSRRREDELASELDAARQLQRVSTQLIQADDIKALYEQILDTATAIMRSEYASIQMLYPERGELRLLGFRGFNPQAAQFWEWVRPASESTCGMALRTGQRCIVSDVERCDFMAGTEDQATYLQTGIRAVQTTPLISRSGALIGMISTHWRRPHTPAERDLRMLDVLARQAADLIDRKLAEDALREADRRKSEFLAMLAHELRNPLAPIRNAFQLMCMKGISESELESVKSIMDRQLTHMVRLIDDLLDASRISRGKIALRKEHIELTSVVKHAIEAARPLCEAGGLEMTAAITPEHIFLDADATRLSQIVGNLLNNAIKFTARGGRIAISAEIEDGQAVIRVQDSGIGIAQEDLCRIFEMFTQLDGSLERAHGGLGIGLSLVKMLVGMHGGTVEARSEGLGKGSEFVVRLPLSNKSFNA